MHTVPLDSWAAQRAPDFAFAVQWILENEPRGQDETLWSILDETKQQSVDWEQWFETWTGNAGPHGVNNAQGLKSSGVWYRQARLARLRLPAAAPRARR